MYVQVYDRHGIPLKRERFSRAVHEVEQGHAEWITVSEVSKRLHNIAVAKAARGETVAADAYYQYAASIRADADAGAAQDKVLWLHRSVSAEAQRKGLQRAEGRMSLRRDVGEALGRLWDEHPESLSGKGVELMFSVGGREVSGGDWARIEHCRQSQ